MAGSGTQISTETQGKLGERQKVRLHGATVGPLQILGTEKRDVPRAVSRDGQPPGDGGSRHLLPQSPHMSIRPWRNLS